MHEDFFSVDEAALIARVTRRTVMRWLQKGILPDRRPKGVAKHIIHASDLSPWLGAGAPTREEKAA